MPFLSFAEGAAMFDTTPIENMFLLEFLPDAPEDCLRVYLYARMLALHPELGSDMTGMAQALRMDEDAVYEAFAYWERQGLARRVADRPPTYELLPVHADATGAEKLMERDYYENKDFNNALQGKFSQSTLLHPQEFSMALDWVKLLGLERDAVLMAVESEVRSSRSKTPDPSRLFRRLDKKMIKWADAGIRTVEDMERALRYEGEVDATAQAVLKRFALRRRPTADELECARRWLGEWHFTQAQVLEACEETTKTRTPSFAYLEAVLKSRLDGDNAYWQPLSEALKDLEGAGAQPTPDLLARYAALRKKGFEAETIRLAATQCRRQGKQRFEDLEWMLDKWGGKGLYAHAAAGEYVKDMEQRTAPIRRVLERFGLDRRPTADELARFERWQARFDAELIDYAAQCARDAEKPIPYMETLLEAWAGEGVTSVEGARRSREAFAAARKRGEKAAPANPALDYEQREYAKDYGKELFIDLDQYGEEGKKA